MQSRAHLTCVHTRVRLTLSAPHTCAPPLGPGPKTRVGIWEPKTVSEAPPSPPFPGPEWSGACLGSQPAHILRHPSLPPVCRGTGIRSHQPGAGEAAKGGGGGSKG